MWLEVRLPASVFVYEFDSWKKFSLGKIFELKRRNVGVFRLFQIVRNGFVYFFWPIFKGSQHSKIDTK